MIPTAITDELATPFALDNAEIAGYQKDGFVVLRGVLSRETIDFFENHVTRQVEANSAHYLPLEKRDTYGKAFLQIPNLWTHDETIAALVRSSRLGRIAAELMECAGARIYHDQALYKEAGGGKTPWHADQFYWPLDTVSTTTAWIPLQDTPLDMGPLAFSPESQHVSFGRDLAISDESDRRIGDFMKTRDQTLVEEPFAAGDVSFHMGWTFHRAGANLTDRPRRVMTVIYMDKDARILEPKSDPHRKDLEAWMPGCKPGEIAASRLNPVVWPVESE